jgi:hypothetical protein
MRRSEAWQAAEMIARNSHSRSGPVSDEARSHSVTVSADSGASLAALTVHHAAASRRTLSARSRCHVCCGGKEKQRDRTHCQQFRGSRVSSPRAASL